MGDSWLTKEQLKVLRHANEDEGFRLPIPTQVISDGEIFPPPQSRQQAMVEALIKERAGVLGKPHGLNRRQFLRTASGMAAAFLAMNDVYGKVFTVDQAEAADFEAADARLAALRDQFIFDAHTHHVHDDYTWEGQLFLLQYSRGDQEAGLPSWTSELEGRELDLKYFKFPHYVKDIFFDSETDVTILSNSPSVVPEKQLLTEDQLVASRNYINGMARTKRVYAHGTIWPSNQPFLDDMDRQAEELKIDSWKGYTIGDPLGLVPEANFPWRLDDEKVTYPAYEKAMKYGIKNLCIHKGLLPVDWKSFENWRYAAVDDVVKAAKDWPELNFIIYHSGFRAFMDVREFAAEFEQTRQDSVGRRFGRDSEKAWSYQRLWRDRAILLVLHHLLPQGRSCHAGPAHPRHGRRPRHLGHGFDLVRLASVADRCLPASGDPHGPAGEIRL